MSTQLELRPENQQAEDYVQLALDLPDVPDREHHVRRGRAALRLFSFSTVLVAALVTLTWWSARTRLNDPDLWWHLRTGQIIWATHSIPTADRFSYTAFGHPWVPQEWLSQLTIYAAWWLGGLSGLAVWLWIASGLLVITSYTLCRIYAGNSRIAFLGGLVTWLCATVGLAIRPHMIGYLLLICELLVLELGRKRDARCFFGLPLIFALWINCHSSFVFGVVIMTATGICALAPFEIGLLTAERWQRRELRVFLLAAVLSVAALFLNPVGLKMLWYPVDVMLNEPLSLSIVNEWKPPDLRGVRGVALLAVAGLILLVPLLRRQRLFLHELVFLSVGFWFATRHQRMLFVFGILAAPVLCRLLSDMWPRHQGRPDHRWPNALIVAGCAAFAIYTFPKPAALEKQVEDESPVRAVEFIKRAGLSGHMLNDYVFGGYLIWALPQHPVFLDGRADPFEQTGVLADYASWSHMEDPYSLLKKYKISFCLLPPQAPVTKLLAVLPDWKQIYSDHQAMIFVRKTASSQSK